MSQEKLLKQVVEKLRTDATLVSSTGHDPTKSNGYRIARYEPPVKGRLPFLGVEMFISTPLMLSDVPQLQVSRFYFHCYASSELTSIRIADRMEALLNPEEAVSTANTEYYDFSGTDVSNKMTRFKRREREFDEDTDSWNDIVEADIIWLNQPCP